MLKIKLKYGEKNLQKSLKITLNFDENEFKMQKIHQELRRNRKNQRKLDKNLTVMGLKCRKLIENILKIDQK